MRERVQIVTREMGGFESFSGDCFFTIRRDS